MALRLLYLVLASGAASGCYWPQDLSVFADIPNKRNSPPRILPTTVTPQLVINVGPQCRPSFSFNVEDPDVADPIRNRWFVYKPGEARGVNFDGFLLPGGSTSVRGPKVQAPDRVFSTVSELTQNGDHILEVVIADGEFNGSSADPLPRTRPLPDGGTVDDPTYIDNTYWFVKTSDTTAPCQ